MVNLTSYIPLTEKTKGIRRDYTVLSFFPCLHLFSQLSRHVAHMLLTYVAAHVAIYLKGKYRVTDRLHFPIPDPSILLISEPISDPDIRWVHLYI